MLRKLFGILSLLAFLSTHTFAVAQSENGFDSVALQSDEKAIALHIGNNSSYLVYSLWLYPSGSQLLGNDLFGTQLIPRGQTFNLRTTTISSCFVDATAKLSVDNTGQQAYYVYGRGINICTKDNIVVTDASVY